MEPPPSLSFNLDALLPADIAKHAEAVGARKCQLAFWPLLTLAILEGRSLRWGQFFLLL
jgi:hypothetical protein